MAIKPFTIGCCLALAAIESGAIAQPAEEFGERGPALFAEATGAYGFQLGETSYLPDGEIGRYKHPLVSGFGVGLTAGWFFMTDAALTAGYEFTSASSRVGEIEGIIDEVQGSIEYHALLLGLRLYRAAGFGRIRVELGPGIILPYQTEVEIDYGPGLLLLPTPVSGTGRQTENFALGYGAHALLGYEFPVAEPLYLATSLRLKVFQSTNAGETTELENFVPDFTATPPAAVTAEIEHGDDATAPSTNSVQDLRLQLGVGARF